MLLTPLRVIAWLLFALLMLFWVIEAAYCVQYYFAGGWPALLGYLQAIAQGHRAGPPPSWSVIGPWHFVILVVTLLLAWFLRWSRRVIRSCSLAPLPTRDSLRGNH